MANGDKILTAVLSGRFESSNNVYLVEQLTSEISRVTKESSTNFNMLGKVVLEQGDEYSSLLVFTDINSFLTIGDVHPLYVKTIGKLNRENLKELPRLIMEAEGIKLSLTPQVQLPTTNIVNQVSLNNMEFGAFLTEDSGFHVKDDPNGLGIDIVEITIPDIRYTEYIHHKVASSALVEYNDGTKVVVGFDEKGRPVYISPVVHKQVGVRYKRIKDSNSMKQLNSGQEPK